VAALVSVLLKQVLWNKLVFLLVQSVFSPLMPDVFAILSIFVVLRLDGDI
jgi:hypothetical protein